MKRDFSPSRRAWNIALTAAVWAAAVLVIALTAGVIGLVLIRGLPHISWNFLSTTASVLKGTDGILPAILNTLYVILLTLLIVLPLGVGAAVYLTEYASNRKLIEVIEFTNETLAGIPSIIYGLVGMLVFAQTMGFKTCLLSGSLTLVVMNLPTIIRTTQESLKTVPQGYREGALGLGAGKWHIIRTIVLPCSIDGIVTGCIHRRCGGGHRGQHRQGVHLQRRDPLGPALSAGLRGRRLRLRVGHRCGAAGVGAPHRPCSPSGKNKAETKTVRGHILWITIRRSSRPRT